MKVYGKMYNQQHTRTPCPECKTHEHTLKDTFHGEIWCSKCGLIIQDSTLPSLTQIIEEGEREERYLRYIYRTRKRRKSSSAIVSTSTNQQ